MSSRKRPHIPKRKRFFLGCEGESERSYGQFLGQLSENRGLPNHIDTVTINGGSPRVIVTGAIVQAKDRSERRGSYLFKALMLDSDKLAESPNGAEKEQSELEHLATNHDILLIWQTPCHEGFLLRHIKDCRSLKPPDSREALSMLRKRWPDYRKPMQVSALVEIISLEDLLHFAEGKRSLRIFLEKLGFTNNP
ncbi:MAG: hypothetical protein ACYCXP_12345 [Leptospirillum sp.]